MSSDPYLQLSQVGRYQLIARIGEGGMGVVYHARHTDLDLDVAIKFLHPHLAAKPGIADRFLREARLAARLQSTGIVRVFDCGETDGHCYIVMERVDGQTLEAHLAKRAHNRFQSYPELIAAIQFSQRNLSHQAVPSMETGPGDTPADLFDPMATVGMPLPRATGLAVRPASPTENRVLLAVDIQNDFCPNGALAVTDGDAVVAVINKLSRRFAHVILTQDWHCEDHLSFASSHPGKKPFDYVELPYGEQILWPDHCIAGTDGAKFHSDLDVDQCELVIRKGYHREIDSYSAFFENDHQTPTGLAGYLRERGLTRLFLVGLATDFCVAYSALDARRLGFEVAVIEEGCRGIDLNGSLDAAWKQLEAAGVIRA